MDDAQLDRLMDYTALHIGAYIALISALVAFFAFKGKDLNTAQWVLFLLALIAFMIAGGAGGIIGASIPEFATWAEFKDARLGPWFARRLLPYTWWRSIEHSAFWVGAILAFTTVFVGGTKSTSAGATKP